MSKTPAAKTGRLITALSKHQPADWEALRDEVLALGDRAFSTPTGESTDLERTLYYTPDADWSVIHATWARGRRIAVERAEFAQLVATTYEICEFRGAKQTAPRRIPRGDANTPWRDGCTVVTEPAEIHARTIQGDRYDLITKPVGTERQEGTIVAKRTIKLPEGEHVQYLVKPRSARAERAYLDAKREEQARIDRTIAIDEAR